MAAKAIHVRSNSFPSAPHSLASQVDEHLNRLRVSSEATSSLSSISHKLHDLQDMHDCVNKLLQQRTTPQAFSRECCKKWVDEQLEGSLRLLDLCCSAKNAKLESKESLPELQSVVRRKRGSETAFTTEGEQYLASRKKVKKAILKALRNLKEYTNGSFLSSLNREKEAFSVTKVLREAESVTLSTLESLLLFIAGAKGPKETTWSAVSKLLHPERVACGSEESESKFEKVDAELQILIGHKACSKDNLQTHMKELESCIDNIEGGLERLHRQLIRTRISLLNTLHQ